MMDERPPEPEPAARRDTGASIFAVYDAIADGVTVQDESGRLVYANAEAARVTGYADARALLAATPGELAKRFELFDADEHPLPLADLPGRRVLSGLPSAECMVRFRTPEGHERWAWVSARALTLAGVRYVVNTFRDGTAVLESKRRYEQILDSVQDLVFTKAHGSVVTYANAAATRHYAMSKEELRGITDVPFNQLDLSQQYLRDDLHVFERGETLEIPAEENIRHDGAVRVFHTIKSPIFDRAGKVVEIVGVSRDITEQRRLERRAVEHAQRLALALEAGQMGVWEWNIAQGKVDWSPALERMHGLAVGSFPGTFEAYKSDIHPDDLEHVLSTVQRTLGERKPHNLLYRIVRPDGQVRWLEAAGQLLLDERGEPERLIGVCRDVTERIEADRTRELLAVEQTARREAERAQAFVQRILEGITDAFAVYDREWRIVFANEASTRPLGLKPADVVGKHAWDITPEAVGSPFYETLHRVMRTQEPATLLDRYAPLNRWFELSAYPLGELGIAVYSRDVTAHKAEEAFWDRLRRHRDLRADVIAALATPREISAMLADCATAVMRHKPGATAVHIMLLDTQDGALKLVARGGSALASTPADSAQAPLEAAVQSCQRKLLYADKDAAELALLAGADTTFYAVFPLHIGERVLGVFGVGGNRVFPDDGIDALDALSTAIAHGVERRHTELALDERARELARSNADLEQFAYVASHDLQEPLRMVASYTQLLARRYRGKLDQDADEFIAFAVEGVTRMQRLINDLLAYSRVGTRGKGLTAVDLEAAFESALANLTNMVQESDAAVTHDPLPVVAGDASQLLQLLQNLIANAIKFRREGVRPEVHVGSRREGADWVLSVRDNGIGIAPQYFERIFVIFQRLNPREQFPGTGIGLAIAKKIIERHGGRIWLESEPGAGTTVYFSLPAQRAAKKVGP